MQHFSLATGTQLFVSGNGAKRGTIAKSGGSSSGGGSGSRGISGSRELFAKVEPGFSAHRVSATGLMTAFVDASGSVYHTTTQTPRCKRGCPITGGGGAWFPWGALLAGAAVALVLLGAVRGGWRRRQAQQFRQRAFEEEADSLLKFQDYLSMEIRPAPI